MTIEDLAKKIDGIEALVLASYKDALNTEEAAAYLGMSKGYLYQLVSARKIPFYKSSNGKMTYFNREELKKWLLCYRIPTNAEVEAEAAARTLNNVL